MSIWQLQCGSADQIFGRHLMHFFRLPIFATVRFGMCVTCACKIRRFVELFYHKLVNNIKILLLTNTEGTTSFGGVFFSSP